MKLICLDDDPRMEPALRRFARQLGHEVQFHTASAIFKARNRIAAARQHLSAAAGRHRRLALTLALAAAAIAGNYFSLPLFFGVDILFGSIAVVLALAWLGTGPGLAVAVAGGTYTWLLWDHPYALIILVAEAAAIGRHRERARRRGRIPPPLAVSATLYWILIGIPLVLLCYRFGLELRWTATFLIAFKQALNGILNAAIAGLILVGTAHLGRRPPGLPLAEVLFGVLLAGVLGPPLLVTSLQNLGIKERLEIAYADRFTLAGQLTLDQLAAERAADSADTSGRPAPLRRLGERLTTLLSAATDPQVRLESGPPPAAAALTLGKRPQPGQRIPTAAPGLFLVVPDARAASRMALWSRARYRLDLPAAASSLPNQRLVIEFNAAPLIQQIQLRETKLLAVLLTLALLGVVAADWLSRRIVTPLRRLAESTRALPTAIGDDQPWQPPTPGLLTETRQLTQAVAEMANSLAAGFKTLREEQDRREVLVRILSEQGEHYRLVVDNIEDLIVRVDVQGRFEYVSPSYCRTFGRHEADLIGQHYLPLVHPDDQHDTTRAVDSLFRPPFSCTIEQRAQTATGWRWFQWFDRALLDAQGQVIGIVGVGRDITERKAAEQALRESEQRFRTLFETMAEGVVYQDADGAITDANPAAERMLGLSLAQLQGRDSTDPRWHAVREDGLPFPSEEHPAMIALRTDTDPGETVMGVFNPLATGPRLSDDTTWLLVHARPERKPGESRPYRVFTTFSDITRLKQTEHRLTAILESSPHGIVEADPLTWRLLWCSGSMLRLFGYNAADWEDQCLTMEDLHPLASLPLVRSEYTRIASADLAPALDLPCRRRDGSIFYCKLSPGLSRIGNDATLIAFFTDVTPEYQARRAVEQARTALLKAQEIAKLGSWELDIAAGVLSWSPEVFRIFEHAPTDFTPDYPALLAAIHPDDRPMVERAYWDSLAKRTPYDLVHRLLLPSGQLKWVHDRCESDFAPDGRPLKSHGTIQDITEQEMAALALADQQRRLSNIIDGTRVGTWEWEVQTGVTVFNARWAEIAGYRLDELTPTSIETWSTLAHPEDLKRSGALIDRHFKGELDSYECELRMRHKDGHWVWVLDQGRVMERDAAGAPRRMSGIHQDITARKLAELAVRQREAIVGELLALAAEFVKAPDQAILALTERAIARIGRFSQADRSYCFRLDAAADTLSNTIEWTAEGIAPMIAHRQAIPLTALPALMIRLRAGAPAVVPRVADLPADWSSEQALFLAQGIRSLLVVPLIVEETLLGCIGFDAVRNPRDWSEVEVHFLQVFASILAGAMERSRATAELRASNARYDELARQSRAIAWEVDAAGRFTYVSPVCEAVLGYQPAELLGTFYYELFAPHDQAAIKAAAQEVFAQQAPFKDFVNCCLTRDGSPVWLLTNGTPLLADDGSLRGYRGMDADITERYLAQDRIKESEGRLAAVFENAPIGMALVGPDRRTILSNRALAAFLGRTAEDLIGLRFDDLTHPDDRDLDVTAFDALIGGGQTGYRMTKRYLHADGRTVWGDLRVALLPTRPGEPPLPLGMVEDITELHAATQRQQILEDAMARYAAQLEQLVDLISLPHPAPEQVRALLRLSCRGLGMAAAVLGIVDEAHGHLTLTRVRDDAPTGAIPELSHALLAEPLTERGSPRLLPPERLPPAATAAGFNCGILIAFDGTHPDGSHATLTLALWGFQPRSPLEKPERQIIRLIAQRIASVRRQDQIQRDLMEAREREAIGHLASGVAHDFNNLLGVIGANIYYLDSCLGNQYPPDAEVRQVLEETQSALGHAKVVTSGILALSRGGHVPLEVVDLEQTIAELERILHHILPSGITLGVTVAPGLTALSNGAFLQSALLNLVLNARDAMADGGVLTVQAHPIAWHQDTPLAVGHLGPMDCVDLRVSDSGSGIAPDILPRIFDPLFSTKPARRGHGLGLFMVQEFIARSGAGLAVQSKPNVGTCFRLLLPQDTTVAAPWPDQMIPAARPARTNRPAAAPLAGLRVLVVDDDPQVREALARLLTLEGANLVLAEHGQACSDLLDQDDAFDLVLSDIAMPVLDGIRLQQRLAQERPTLPVILMTGQAPALSDTHAGDKPPLILRKPLDAATLRAAILNNVL